MNEFIVAEISKNWIKGMPLKGKLLSQQFEDVIEVNRQRGYTLHSFQISSVIVSNEFNETLIAVFRKLQLPETI